MTYLSDKRRKRTYWGVIFGAIAFFLFVYYWTPFKQVAYPIVEPVVQGYNATKVFSSIVPSFVSTYVTTHRTLYERVQLLERDIERLENLVAQKDAEIREGNLITLGTTGGAKAPVVLMYPLIEDKTEIYSTIILSKGYKDGIENNTIVYIRGMQPVCEIVEVYDRTSRCELLSKGGRITEGVTSSSTLTISLSGLGGGDFVAELPKGTKIEVGEEVFLRSNQSFRLGEIVSVMDDDQATGVSVFVRGTYNPVTSSVFYWNPLHAR